MALLVTRYVNNVFYYILDRCKIIIYYLFPLLPTCNAKLGIGYGKSCSDNNSFSKFNVIVHCACNELRYNIAYSPRIYIQFG